MLYLLAVIFPSIAMLLCGRVMQAILCFILQIFLITWPIAAIWACFVVSDTKAKERHEQMMATINRW